MCKNIYMYALLFSDTDICCREFLEEASAAETPRQDTEGLRRKVVSTPTEATAA